MGQLLAQKQAAAAAATAAGATASAYAATAQVKAGEAMDQAGEMAASAKQQIIKGVHRAKNITPEEKAKLLSRASTVLTIASIVCPAGRVAKIGGKGLLIRNILNAALQGCFYLAAATLGSAGCV